MVGFRVLDILELWGSGFSVRGLEFRVLGLLFLCVCVFFFFFGGGGGGELQAFRA